MTSAGPAKAQITILYDAFGKDSAMQKDWGYAALVEYGGKRILFDTGNNPEALAQSAKAKSIDLEPGFRCHVAPPRRSHGRTGVPVEGEPQSEDLRAEGGVWRLWRRLAEQLFVKDKDLRRPSLFICHLFASREPKANIALRNRD
jgi:hypothetical protein